MHDFVPKQHASLYHTHNHFKCTIPKFECFYFSCCTFIPESASIFFRVQFFSLLLPCYFWRNHFYLYLFIVTTMYVCVDIIYIVYGDSISNHCYFIYTQHEKKKRSQKSILAISRPSSFSVHLFFLYKVCASEFTPKDMH